MSIDRAERTGFGVAFAGHVLLFAMLWLGFVASPPPLVVERRPVEVQLVDEVGLESGAPEISFEAPAPKLGEVEAPVEPPQPVAQPAPAARPEPPQPKAAPREAPTPPKSQPRTKATRPTGRLSGLLEGVSDQASPSRSTAPPAATITPAVQASLAAAVRRQLRPHWSAPSGADADKLRTELSISLARDGTVTDIAFLRQTGVTPSNRAQADLHRERAIRAVRLASPFELPPDYYDAWKLLSPIGFDARLSQ